MSRNSCLGGAVPQYQAHEPSLLLMQAQCFACRPSTLFSSIAQSVQRHASEEETKQGMERQREICAQQTPTPSPTAPRGDAGAGGSSNRDTALSQLPPQLCTRDVGLPLPRRARRGCCPGVGGTKGTPGCGSRGCTRFPATPRTASSLKDGEEQKPHPPGCHFLPSLPAKQAAGSWSGSTDTAGSGSQSLAAGQHSGAARGRWGRAPGQDEAAPPAKTHTDPPPPSAGHGPEPRPRAPAPARCLPGAAAPTPALRPAPPRPGPGGVPEPPGPALTGAAAAAALLLLHPAAAAPAPPA